MFADIVDSTVLSQQLGEDYFSEVNHDYIFEMSRIARHYGAGIVLTRGDGVLAVFGLPTAQEGAGRAALNAAIEIRRQVPGIGTRHGLSNPLEVSTGIATGWLVAKDIGDPTRPIIDVAGLTANLGARLSGHARPNQILLCETTRQTVERDFELHPLPPVQLKGITGLVRSFELLSQRERRYRHARGSEAGLVSSDLVDRVESCRAIREALGQLAQGRGGVLAICGEAGIGKSRLIAESRRSEEAEGLTWLVGRSIAIGEGLSYHPFGDLLRSWAGISEEAGSSALEPLEGALEELLGDAARDELPMLASVASLDFDDAERRKLDDVVGDGVERLIWRSVKLLLRSLLTRRPVVVVLDDLHWADASSLRLLESLLPMARSERILFYLVHRPELPPAVQRLIEALREEYSEHYTELQLEPLTGEESRLLVENFIGRGEVPVKARRSLIERSSGNPFMAEELVHSLIEGGGLEPFEDGLQATNTIDSIEVPTTIREVIRYRLDLLPDHRREALEIASVIGRSFHLPVLAELCDDKDKLLEDLDVLVASQLLIRRHRMGSVEYVFRHPLAQEIAYDSIVRKRRRLLHGRVAEALKLTGDAVPGYLGMLAYHYGAANNRAAADEYLIKAGDEAARSAASDEALLFFQKAFDDFLESDEGSQNFERQVHLERQLAFARFNRGQLVQANEHFNQYLRLHGEKVASWTVHKVFRVIQTLALIYAEPLVERVRKRPAADESDREVLDVMFNRARAETQVSPVDFVFHSMDTLRKLQWLDPTSVENAAGMFAGAVGLFTFGGLSESLSERFLQRGEALVDPADVQGMVLCRGMRFIHHTLSGDWDDRHVVSDELVESGLRQGCFWDLTTYLGFLAKQRVHQGRFAEAEQALARLHEIADLYSYDMAQQYRLAVSTLLSLEREDLDDALDAAQDYVGILEEDAVRVFAMGILARVYIEMGQLQAAEEVVREGLAIRSKLRMMVPYQEGTILRSKFILELARIDDRAGESERGRMLRQAERSGKRAWRSATRVASDRAEVLRVQGRVAWERGRGRAAIDAWRKALHQVGVLGMAPERARLCLEIGSALGEPGTRVSALDGRGPDDFIREAGEIRAELGIARELDPL